jgi:hypothetical protein
MFRTRLLLALVAVVVAVAVSADTTTTTTVETTTSKAAPNHTTSGAPNVTTTSTAAPAFQGKFVRTPTLQFALSMFCSVAAGLALGLVWHFFLQPLYVLDIGTVNQSQALTESTVRSVQYDETNQNQTSAAEQRSGAATRGMASKS